MRHLVLLDGLQDARHVEHVALLEIDLVDDVADQAVVAVAGEDHRPVTLLDELAAGFGADDAHAAGDQDLHASAPDCARCSLALSRDLPAPSGLTGMIAQQSITLSHSFSGHREGQWPRILRQPWPCRRACA